MRITRARKLDTVLRLDREIFPEIAPPPLDGRAWWLAWDGRRPIGFAGLLLAGHVAYLSRAGVVESARGKGVHHDLIRTRIEYARERGARAVLTYTMGDNARSANNLISEGFRIYVPDEPWFEDDSGVVYWRLAL